MMDETHLTFPLKCELNNRQLETSEEEAFLTTHFVGSCSLKNVQRLIEKQ